MREGGNNLPVIQLADYKKLPAQPMSKRTFDASIKSVTKQIEQGKLTAEQGNRQIQSLIHKYFFSDEG